MLNNLKGIIKVLVEDGEMVPQKPKTTLNSVVKSTEYESFKSAVVSLIYDTAPVFMMDEKHDPFITHEEWYHYAAEIVAAEMELDIFWYKRYESETYQKMMKTIITKIRELEKPVLDDIKQKAVETGKFPCKRHIDIDRPALAKFKTASGKALINKYN